MDLFATTTSAQSVEMNEELHFKTIEALNHAYEKRLTLGDLEVLCYHCGIPVKEITQPC